jgi:spermidine/putrescine transport system substrate-binding protein
MEKYLKHLSLLLLAVLLSSCARELPTLHIYTWADYISPDLVKRFEDEQGCKVVIDTFDSNESMYARLKAGGGGYDVIFPTSYMIKVMNDQGMLLPLDHSMLPNIKSIDPECLKLVYDQKMEHSVPYTLGYAVIAYRKDKVQNLDPSWAVFGRADLQKRMTLLNDMRESLGAALKFLGYSINTRDEKQLSEARDVLLSWKKNIAKFENEAYKGGIDSGEFHLVHGYSGDLAQVAAENEEVIVAVPKEGATIGCDEMVIPRDAAQTALAHAFINFLCEAKVSAENMEWMGYLCPNVEALKLVSEDFLKNPAVTITPEVKAKCEAFEDLGADLAKYTKVWDEVKAGE